MAKQVDILSKENAYLQEHIHDLQEELEETRRGLIQAHGIQIRNSTADGRGLDEVTRDNAMLRHEIKGACSPLRHQSGLHYAAFPSAVLQQELLEVREGFTALKVPPLPFQLLLNSDAHRVGRHLL